MYINKRQQSCNLYIDYLLPFLYKLFQVHYKLMNEFSQNYSEMNQFIFWPITCTLGYFSLLIGL